MKLILILTSLVCFALAAPQPATKKPIASKAKAPVAGPKKAATPAVAAKRPVAAAKAPVRARTGAPAARAANSRAVYSRTPARSARGSAGQRAPAARPVQAAAPPRPSQERYQEIQQALADKGYFSGEVNGVWSPESVEALKTFQRSQNLDADGKLGSLSLIALGLGPKRLVAAEIPPPSQQQPQPQQPAAQRQ
jgi:murein L,D-transpeptidase YcbB/YkuD